MVTILLICPFSFNHRELLYFGFLLPSHCPLLCHPKTNPHHLSWVSFYSYAYIVIYAFIQIMKASLTFLIRLCFSFCVLLVACISSLQHLSQLQSHICSVFIWLMFTFLSLNDMKAKGMTVLLSLDFQHFSQCPAHTASWVRRNRFPLPRISCFALHLNSPGPPLCLVKFSRHCGPPNSIKSVCNVERTQRSWPRLGLSTSYLAMRAVVGHCSLLNLNFTGWKMEQCKNPFARFSNNM